MNYSHYKMRKKEKGKYGLFYIAMAVFFTKLFYDSYLAGLAVVLLLPVLWKRKAKMLAQKRQIQLVKEFKDFILSFSSTLKAGYSVENAFVEAYADLKLLYEEESMMVTECQIMIQKQQNNIMLEKLLFDFGERSCIPDIRDFSVIFEIAKHSGGNLSKIIENTAQVISDKIAVKTEIQILFASKKLEQTIMNAIPLAIICYIRLTSPGYFNCLYGNIAGIVIMTICLLLYFCAYLMSQKIMQIEV